MFHNMSKRNKKTMGGQCSEGSIADRRTGRFEGTSWGQRKMEAPSEGGQGPRRGCSAIRGWKEYEGCREIC